MDAISEKLKNLNFNKFIDLKQKIGDNVNLDKKLLDKKQEQRSLQNEERILSTNNINLKIAIKELINTIDPALITKFNEATSNEETFNEATSNEETFNEAIFDKILISVLKELKKEYNKISKKELLNELNKIEEKKLEIKHIGGNLEDLKIKVNKFYNDKIILMARLTELQKKIQNIVSIYNKILSGEDKINEISKLEKEINDISTKITRLTKNEKILKNLKTKLDEFKPEIDRLESKLTPRIIESINSAIDNLEKKLAEINGREHDSFSGTMSKYKFNLININLQGGTLTELLVKMKNFTKNKQDIKEKIINLKIEMIDLIENSGDKKLSKDKYDSIDNTIQKLKEEINKLPDSFNI